LSAHEDLWPVRNPHWHRPQAIRSDKETNYAMPTLPFSPAAPSALWALSALAALLATSACWLLLPSVASATDYTWSGEGLAAAPSWSNPANWSGGSAPPASSSIGTLSFPTLVPPLPDNDCFGASPLDACYHSVNDLSGLSVNQLQIAGQGASYTISGQGLTLGSGGLAFTASGGPGVMAKIATPITLGANQTWEIGGAHGESADLQVSGQLSGENADLTIDLNSLRELTLGELNSPTQADDELGDVVINGLVEETGGKVYRTPVELEARLNTTDGHSLTVHNADLGVDGTGPLTATNSIVGLDGSATGPVAFNDSLVFTEQNSYFAPSFSLEGTSSLEFTIGREGTTPGTNYSQVTSSGTVALGGAALELQDKAFDEGAGECSPPVAGQVYTLVSASTITGTFSEIPDGGTALADCAVFKAGAIVSERAYPYRINYNLGTSPETVTATSLLAVPTTPETPTTGGNTNTGGSTNSSGGGSASSGSNPGNVTATISSAQLKASLAGQLTPTGKAVTIPALLKQGDYSLSFTASEAGRLTVQWYELPAGAKLAKRGKANPVLVASGALTFTAAGTGKVKIRLTAAGRRLLKHAKSLKLTARGMFTMPGVHPVTATGGFVLRGSGPYWNNVVEVMRKLP
jgi:hypothetical protein